VPPKVTTRDLTYIPRVVGLKRIVGVAHLALRATRGTPSCIAAYAWGT